MALLNIKRNVYELALSEEKDRTCLPVATKATPQQFLDVETNRNRTVFFNSAEQEVFKRCFFSPSRLAKLGKTALKAGNKWRRIEALLALGYAQAESAVKILKSTILNKDGDISYFSIISLGQLKTPEAAKILLDFVKKSSFGRYKIASILESFPPEITGGVIELTKSHDPQLRAWAVNLLYKFKPVYYHKEIEALTKDESDDVRAAACRCLGKLAISSAKSALSKCLKDASWLVRSNAVIALSDAFGAECVGDIIGLINDGSISVIDSVKEVMSRHIEISLPYIEQILKQEDGFAKRTVSEALDKAGYDPLTLKPKSNKK